jgi:hypothetical protein
MRKTTSTRSKVSSKTSTKRATKISRKTSSTRTSMRDTISSMLRKNPKMSTGDVYLQILRSKGINTNNTNLTTFFNRMSSYPSFRSVYETTRSLRSQRVVSRKTSHKLSRG